MGIGTIIWDIVTKMWIMVQYVRFWVEKYEVLVQKYGYWHKNLGIVIKYVVLSTKMWLWYKNIGF